MQICQECLALLSGDSRTPEVKATFLTTKGGMHMDTQRKPLLQLKGCTTANSKIQEIWETDPSWQASIRTKHLFISFLVSEPWQTLHFHILIWAFIPFFWVVLGLFFLITKSHCICWLSQSSSSPLRKCTWHH